MEPGGRPELGAKVIRTTRQAKEADISDIISRLAEKLYRIKGYIRLDNDDVLAVQASFGNVELIDDRKL